MHSQLTEMAVKPAFRRQGIATSLLRAVDGMADKLGAAYLCLFCETTNRGAVRLYEEVGYHSVGASPSVEAFATALGLPASKAYGFMYRPLGAASPFAAARPQQRLEEGEEAGAEPEESEYAISRRAAKGPPSLLPGQPGLLGRMGQRAFSWW
jgi:hypothetical protein